MRLSIWSIAFVTTCLPLRAEIDGITRKFSACGVTEYHLDSNDLTILLAPIQGAGAATFCITYRVGSRNESYGTTGATHLLEHLMFKGTANRNKQAGNGIDQMLEGLGASTNAYTGRDSTCYVTTLAPEHLPVIIALEADRMRNLRLREEDLIPERTVVFDEFDLAEDNPFDVLDRETWAAALTAHPYRHDALGWRSDVENVTIEQLRGFYDAHYWPDQATVTITGALGSEENLLREIQRVFGSIPHAPKPVPQVVTAEPRQTGLRRFDVNLAGETDAISIAFKSPSANDPDFPALVVLSDILADGQSSPFYNRLTAEGLTLDVTATPEPTRDPSLLTITAELTGDAKHEKVEETLLDILDGIIEDGVTEDILRTSIIRLTAKAAFDRDGSDDFAEVLSASIATGDWTHYQKLEAAIREVTPAAVKQAAKRWLQEEQCTIGWLIADTKAKDTSPAGQPAIANKTATENNSQSVIHPELPPVDMTTVPEIAPGVTRARGAGIDVLVRPGGSPGIVHLSGSFPVGTPADETLACFTAAMIERGTLKHDAVEIGDMLERSGSTLEFSVSDGFLNIQGRCLSPQLPGLLLVLAEQLREPSFPEVEIRSMRARLVEEAHLSDKDPQALADLAFRRALYPQGSPSRPPDAEETVRLLKTIGRKELAAFHKEWFGPAGAILVLAGDVEPAACMREVEKGFSGWTGGKQTPEIPLTNTRVEPVHQRLPLPGKETVQVRMGQAVRLPYDDADTRALMIATSALGNGFTSRLVHTVRDTEGLTYGIQATLGFPNNQDGVWDITASFAPQFLEQGLSSIHREVARWHKDGLTEGEFAYSRNAFIGARRVELSTTEAIADTLLSTVRRGLPPEWIDENLQRIQSLTLDEVNAAIRKHLDPSGWIEITSGNLPK